MTLLTLAHRDALVNLLNTDPDGAVLLLRSLAAQNYLDADRVESVLAEAILPTPVAAPAPASTITLNVVVPGTPGEEEDAAVILEAPIPGAQVVGFKDVRDEPLTEVDYYLDAGEEAQEPVEAPAPRRRFSWRL